MKNENDKLVDDLFRPGALRRAVEHGAPTVECAPLPWRGGAVALREIYAADGSCVAAVVGPHGELPQARTMAHRDLIVRAVNSLPMMIEALERILPSLEREAENDSDWDADVAFVRAALAGAK